MHHFAEGHIVVAQNFSTRGKLLLSLVLTNLIDLFFETILFLIPCRGKAEGEKGTGRCDEHNLAFIG